ELLGGGERTDRHVLGPGLEAHPTRDEEALPEVTGLEVVGRDHHPNAVIGLGGLSVVAEALVDEQQDPGREQTRTHGDRDPRVGECASQLHPERGSRMSSHHCSCWSVPPVVSVLRLSCTAVVPRFCLRRGRARGAHLTSRTSPHSAPSTATLAFPT